MLGLTLIIVLCVKYRARFIGLFLALILSAGAMLLSAAGMYRGTIYAKPDGDPADAVRTFFDAVCAGDYTTAYAQLRDYSDLGLGTTPASPAGQKVYQALRDSYSYALQDECRVDKLEAVQAVTVTRLDLARLEDAVAAETQHQLERIVAERPVGKVYDENRQVLPDVADEAYLAALDAVLPSAQDYYTVDELNVPLSYADGRWQIVADSRLLSALAGGIS